MPRIYTRTGDRGDTSLWRHAGTPRRVPKEDVRVEAYGSVDELNAHVGAIRAEVEPGSDDDAILERIQRTLFTVGTELATPDLPEEAYQLTSGPAKELERAIDALEKTLPRLTRFILPTGPRSATASQVARTICRRAERRVWALSRQESVDAEIGRYLNRLSDFLFVFSRHLTHVAGREEEIWREWGQTPSQDPPAPK